MATEPRAAPGSPSVSVSAPEDGEDGPSPHAPSSHSHAHAHSPSRPPPTSSTRSGLVTPRSCYACNQKKIRCNKAEPSCTACTRAGRPCEYPPVGPRIRRKKRTIIAEMSSRISDLEKTLHQVREGAPAANGASSAQTADPPCVAGQLKDAMYAGAASHRTRPDVIVQKGSSSQYFNEIILSRVIKEERDIEAILTPQATPPGLSSPSPFNAAGILSSPSLGISPASLHPPNHLAARLWTIYIENVEACAGLKLLHQPTDEVKVYSVIDNPALASPENLALAFAIYFASTVSLSPAEAGVILEHDKNTTLLQFKLGLEQSFAHADFLDRPTISGLHALAIYVAALRVHNRGKGIWILNGLAVRIAQSLGLHRDGKRLGLSPFQAEIRRRLWWHLLSRDSRAGEDYGLENTNNKLLFSDVDLPANVHDADLWPEMEEPPVPKAGWTPMTFSLINISLARAMQKLASIAAASSPSAPPSEDVRAQVLEETRAHAEKWLVHCNPVIPQQRLTLLCTRFLFRKIDFVTRQQWVLLRQRGSVGGGLQQQQQQQQQQAGASGGGGADSSRERDFVFTDENLAEALSVLEPKLYADDGLLRQFAWTRRAYPQYHVAMYVLLHLCVSPEGPDVERAWRAVDSFFADETADCATIGFGSKMPVLSILRAKAMARREKLQGGGGGGGGVGAGAVDSSGGNGNGSGNNGNSHSNRRPGLGDGERGCVGAAPGEAGGALDAGAAAGGGTGNGSGPAMGLQSSEAPNVGDHEFGHLDASLEDWPDWAMLVHDFPLDTSDVFT